MSPSAAPMVELDGVSLRYGGHDGVLALEGASLSLAEGEFAAVVGPSGCGKSSLMKLITGLLPPSAGRPAVAGHAVRGPLKIAGMAFQNPTMQPWRRTIENVLLLEIAQPHRGRLGRERARYEAAFLADRVFVMSNRPANVVATHRIDLPRPRTLADTFAPEFTSLVRTMHEQIGQQRQIAGQIAGVTA